jgi:hypothetical protein
MRRDRAEDIRNIDVIQRCSDGDIPFALKVTDDQRRMLKLLPLLTGVLNVPPIIYSSRRRGSLLSSPPTRLVVG